MFSGFGTLRQSLPEAFRDISLLLTLSSTAWARSPTMQLLDEPTLLERYLSQYAVKEESERMWCPDSSRMIGKGVGV
ncbi:hypothetical protein MHYP_G00119420 [Metynnis hypsauchen]